MTPTPPTRRQIDEMTQWQQQRWGMNRGDNELGTNWTFVPYAKYSPQFAPAPSAGTCITPSPQGETS